MADVRRLLIALGDVASGDDARDRMPMTSHVLCVPRHRMSSGADVTPQRIESLGIAGGTGGAGTAPVVLCSGRRS